MTDSILKSLTTDLQKMTPDKRFARVRTILMIVEGHINSLADSDPLRGVLQKRFREVSAQLAKSEREHAEAA